MDRAFGFYPNGWGFESLGGYQNSKLEIHRRYERGLCRFVVLFENEFQMHASRVLSRRFRRVRRYHEKNLQLAVVVVRCDHRQVLAHAFDRAAARVARPVRQLIESYR